MSSLLLLRYCFFVIVSSLRGQKQLIHPPLSLPTTVLQPAATQNLYRDIDSLSRSAIDPAAISAVPLYVVVTYVAILHR